MAISDPAQGYLERLAAQAQAGRQSIAGASALPSLRDAMPYAANPDALLQSLARARAQAMPAAPAPAGVASVGGGGGGDAGGFNPEFQRRLNALVAASGGRLSIGSGYRTPQRQAELFAAAVKKYGSVAAARKWVAPPGHSKHNMGLAADLRGDLNLAHQLAGQFGLYFPLPNEAWHVELRGSRG